jgi:PA14 domain-containing protein
VAIFPSIFPSTPTPTITPSPTPGTTPTLLPDPPHLEEWCVYPQDDPPATFLNCPVQVWVGEGQTVIIHWKVSNVTGVEIDPSGNQDSMGEIPYTVSTGRMITLKTLNATPSLQKSIELIVTPSTPSASATPTLVTPTRAFTSTTVPTTSLPISTPTFTLTNMPINTPTRALTPTDTPTPPLIYPGPWRAEYYDNENLSGSPRIIRDEPIIKFNWNQKPPADGMPLEHWSARWTSQSQLCFENSSFYVHHDDALRLYFDGNVPYDGTTSNDRWLSFIRLTGCYTVKIEFRQFTGGASVDFASYQP